MDQFAWVEEAASSYDKNVAIRAIDECAGLLTGFAQTIRRDAVEKDRILRGDGITFPAGEDRGRWTGADDQDIRDQAEALKAALFPVPIFEPAPHSTPEVSKAGPSSSPRFQVALSFAGEQRTYVRQVADALAARHIAVFYDEFQANTLWGRDGAEHFHQIYSRDTQYVVLRLGFPADEAFGGSGHPNPVAPGAQRGGAALWRQRRGGADVGPAPIVG